MARGFTLSTRARERGRKVDLRPLLAPLPPELEALLGAKLTKPHRLLGERLEKARRDELDAATALEAARGADRDAAVAAARAGRDAPEPTVPAAEQALAAASATRAAHEDAILESANGLLAEALPRLADARASVDEQVAGEKRRRRELLEAAAAAGVRAGQLEVELDWIVAAARGGAVQPFRPGSRSSATDTAIRQALAVEAELAAKRAADRARDEQGRKLIAERERARAGIPQPQRPQPVVVTLEPGAGARVEPVEAPAG